MASLFEDFANFMKKKLPSLNQSEADQCFILADLNKPLVEPLKTTQKDQVWIVRTKEDLLLLRDKLGDSDVITLDIETSSLEPREGFIVGIGLGIEGLVAYIPIAHTLAEDNILLPDQLSLFEVVSTLDLKSKKFISHNAKFKLAWFKFYAGVELQFDWDTFLASKLFQPDMTKDLEPEDLERVAIRELDVTPWSLSPRSMNAFQSVDLSIASSYCGKNVLYTYQISQTQKKAMAALSIFLMRDVEIPLISVVAELEANGYLIDCDHFTELKARLEPEQALVLADIQAITGTGINPASPKQLSKLLYEDLSLPVFKKTENGNPSTDEEALTPLIDAHPVVGKILKFKKIAIALSTGCKFPLEVDHDSRLRPKYNQMGAITGRFSATKKIHQLPNDDRFGIRNGFIAPPGFKIVGADFDQQELYILASVSGDQAMLDAIANGVDLHALAAKKVFGLDCELDEVKKLHPEKRKQVKEVQFGILYGSGAQSLAKKLSLSLQAAEELIDGYFAIFPQVKSFIDDTHDFTTKNGFYVDVFGRRRFFPNAQLKAKSKLNLQSKALREAQNFPIQAAAATITKLAMIRCHNHIRESHPRIKMVLSLHDELHFEVPNTEVKHFAAELPTLMTNLGIESFGFKVPFKVSVKSGQSWGTMVSHKPANQGVIQ